MNRLSLRHGVPGAALALLVILACVAHGLGALSVWVLQGTAPGAWSWGATWPLGLLALLGALVLLGGVRRPGWAACTGSAVVWAASFLARGHGFNPPL